MSAVKDRVIQIIVEKLGVDASEVTEQASFTKDLKQILLTPSS